MSFSNCNRLWTGVNAEKMSPPDEGRKGAGAGHPTFICPSISFPPLRLCKDNCQQCCVSVCLFVCVRGYLRVWVSVWELRIALNDRKVFSLFVAANNLYRSFRNFSFYTLHFATPQLCKCVCATKKGMPVSTLQKEFIMFGYLFVGWSITYSHCTHNIFIYISVNKVVLV